jgi:hypothetical protein
MIRYNVDNACKNAKSEEKTYIKYEQDHLKFVLSH